MLWSTASIGVSSREATQQYRTAELTPLPQQPRACAVTSLTGCGPPAGWPTIESAPLTELPIYSHHFNNKPTVDKHKPENAECAHGTFLRLTRAQITTTRMGLHMIDSR
jgi:hypothetical protein